MSIKFARLSVFAAVVGMLLLSSSAATAQSSDRQAPTLFNYGIKGFGVGAGLGLSVAQLSGATYDGRWRTAITIAGVGGLTGIGGGLTLGLFDAPQNGGLAQGYHILRSAESGQMLGGLAGAATGALVWLNDGRARNLFDGAAVGALAGTVLGVVYGSVTGRSRRRSRSDGIRVAFHTFATANATAAPGLMAVGSF